MTIVHATLYYRRNLDEKGIPIGILVHMPVKAIYKSAFMYDEEVLKHYDEDLSDDIIDIYLNALMDDFNGENINEQDKRDPSFLKRETEIYTNSFYFVVEEIETEEAINYGI